MIAFDFHHLKTASVAFCVTAGMTHLDEHERAIYRCRMGDSVRTIERGRYYEDFTVGDFYRHHWGRTLTDGECQLFATATMNAVPLYFNQLHAEALGHPRPPAHPLFVMNVVFGMTVEDLSEQAIAHLGYWNMRFPRFCYPGDTLLCSSEVLDKRESGSKPDRGIVHVRTIGQNQRGEEVCLYERKILVKKRASYGGKT